MFTGLPGWALRLYHNLEFLKLKLTRVSTEMHPHFLSASLKIIMKRNNDLLMEHFK